MPQREKQPDGELKKNARTDDGKVVPIDPEQKKEKKGRIGILLPIALFALLIGFGVFSFFAVTRDWFGVRTALISAVNQLDPQNEYAVLLEREQAVLLEEKNLQSRQDALSEEERRLAQYENELAQRESILSQREFNSTPAFRRNLTQDERDNLAALGKLYAQMDPTEAARILKNLYSVNDMASVLFFMAPDPAAKLLQSLDSKTAAEITQVLLD